MNGMKSFSSALQRTLRTTAEADVLAAKAARANQVKQMWRGMVEQVFLDHTNAVYIIREEDRKILIVYVDESIFAAELNARREMIKLKFLERFGERIDDFRILISRGRYKENHPFREEEPEPFYVEKAAPVPLSSQKLAEIEEGIADIPDENLRKALKKAMISDLEWKNGIELEKSENEAS